MSDRRHPPAGEHDRGHPPAEERDDQLVAALRRIAAEADPLPEQVRAAARAAFITRDLDAQLAVLVGDSADLAGLAETFELVRTDLTAVPASRLLAFAGGGVQIDLEVSGHGEQLTVVGQLTGASTHGCGLEHAGSGLRALELDGLSRFRAEGARRGPVRVRCRSLTGIPVTTAWVTI